MFFSKFFCKEKHVLETCGTICFLPIKEAVKMDEDIILVCSFTLIKKFIIQYFPWLGFKQHIIFFNIFFLKCNSTAYIHAHTISPINTPDFVQNSFIVTTDMIISVIKMEFIEFLNFSQNT